MNERALPHGKILVIDDNEANRELARESLEDEGHVVIVATSGGEGITAFDRHHPDCVLLDVRMPDLDGFRVCQELRDRPDGADTPIIFLTALRDVDTFDQALRAGGDDFLTKPIRPTELVVRVHTALQLRKMKTELRKHYELFKQQRDALVRLQLQKERVIAFVVHDLKNPVNTIDLHAQTILRNRALPILVHESAHQIRAETRHLVRMILNLLDVAKADEGQLAPRPRPLALAPLVESMRDELRITAANRRVQIDTVLGANAVYADEDLLRRVLTNLVDNAVRYSPASTTVVVESHPRLDGVELRVRDHGPGIPPALREKVFDPFTQDDPEALASENRGLGLAFCKRAVEAHGGRVWVEDASPGARFCAFLPAAHAA